MDDSEYPAILHLWLGTGITALVSEIDGFVCGLLTRGATATQLHELLFAEDEMSEERQQQCETAMKLRYQQLMEFGDLFEPLIEEDTESLTIRTDSLATWCYGFLATLGDQQELRDRLSDDSYESLQDLQEITQVTADSNDNENEDAFYELFEYVRVAVSLLITDLSSQQQNSDNDTLH